MLILLVGPSNIGKSTQGSDVCERIPDCEFHDLDDLIGKYEKIPASTLLPKVGADEFAKISFNIIKKVSEEYSDKICLIAVGAGTLESLRTIDFLKKYNTVAFLAPAKEVYQRDRMREQRTLEEFTQIEYSDYRMSIYNSATYQHKIDGLIFDQACKELFKLIKKIL